MTARGPFGGERWQFIELQPGAAPARWIWRVLAADGAIRSMSFEMVSRQAAMADAAQHGFDPAKAHYLVITKDGISHFEPSPRPGPAASRSKRSTALPHD